MPSFRQLRTTLYAKRAGLILVVLLLGGGLYYGIQTNAWKDLLSRFSNIGNLDSQTNSDVAEKMGTSDFHQQLDQSNTQQLILQSTELVDSPNEPLLIRLDRQQKKILVAEKLMEKVDDPRATAVGVATRLAALRTRELIQFDNNLTSQESLEELANFASQNINNTDDNVNKQARLGKIQSTIFAELQKSGNPEFSVSPEIVDEFRSTCARFPDDAIAARELYKILERVLVRASAEDHKKFTSAFTSIYENSEKERLQIMAANISKSLVDTEFELVDIFDSIDSLQGEAVEKLSTQITNALELSFVSPQGYRRIIGRIRDIASIGDYATAQELSDLLNDKVSNKPNLREIAEVNQKLRNQFKMANRAFSTQGIKTLDGQPYSFRHADADVKAIYFMALKDFKESDVNLLNIMRIAGRFAMEKRFCLLVVYLDDGEKPDGLAEVKRIAGLVGLVDFASIDTGSDEGKALLERLSIVQTPLLLMLNKDNELVGIDISQKDFEKKFFEVLGNE